jgi:2-C-methyl-D-erythritol 4-phosphate cytidylyltransferase
VRLSAVIVAAGRSQRFNLGRTDADRLSKQLITWNNKPLFVHTMEALMQLPLVETALVIHPEEEEAIHENLRKFFPNTAVKIVFGGARRQDSVRNGLTVLSEVDRVLVHDAARPFLAKDFLQGLFDKAKTVDAVIPVMPVIETLKEIDESGKILKTHNRNKFVSVQTPQFFNFSILKAAHEKFQNSSEEFTDDAAVVEACGFRVDTLPGKVENIKITLPEDLRSRGIHV